MIAGKYLLVTFDDKQKLTDAAEKLNTVDSIRSWDAVDGHYHLLVNANSDSDTAADSIKALDGFSSLTECVIETDNQKNYDLDDSFTYAYLFIESDSDSKQDLSVKLNLLDNIEFCSETSGPFTHIALVKDENFDKIDKFIKREVKDLDGILRYKQDYVLFLDRM
ncbi:MAG: hypothetical protein DWP97_04430 [Calditrichaeota bacterium]|nr:MAG: hypothetical protein DWP97_04430 [Calditrichota bacterium]